MTNADIIKFLTSKTANAGLVDKLKIKYRPVICPFIDLLGFAKDRKRIFDVGCGSGQFCALLAKYTGANDIMGIEISEHLVKNAYEVNAEFLASKKMRFEHFNGKTLPADIKNYELVYMIDVYHHIPPAQQKAFVEELYQKMAPGATLVFKDINAASPLVFFNKLHDLVFSREIGREISLANAKELFSKAGFTIRSHYTKTTFVYPHYFLICEKPL